MLAFRMAVIVAALCFAAVSGSGARAAEDSPGGMYSASRTGHADSRLSDRAFDTRPAASIDELVRELSRAIDLLSRYRIPKEPPRVYRVPRFEMENYVCGANCNIQAWYKPGDGIFLDESLRPETNLMHRSILLHELVHYFQDTAGTYGDRSSCERWFQREIDAYNIQNRYLGVIGHPSRVAYTGDNCANMESKARGPERAQTFGAGNTQYSRPASD
jgi:hypothetical protein